MTDSAAPALISVKPTRLAAKEFQKGACKWPTPRQQNWAEIGIDARNKSGITLLLLRGLLRRSRVRALRAARGLLGSRVGSRNRVLAAFGAAAGLRDGA